MTHSALELVDLPELSEAWTLTLARKQSEETKRNRKTGFIRMAK